jgi:SAM-dependent methyltransferase
VIASVHRALKPGGRFVAEFGGAGCVQTVRLALVEAANRRGLDGAAIDPWFFPSEADYRARLEAHGFDVRAITLFPRPTPLPGDITDWLETFAQPFLGAVPPAERGGFLQDVRAAVQPALFDAASGWSADYVRLRFDARKMH